jgi:transglutaminase-like putative cysteine protease
MARTQSTPARAQRLNAVLAVSLLAATTSIALGRVFAGKAPTAKLVAASVASGLLACAMQRRNLLLSAVVSGVGMIAAVGVLVFPETTLHGLPTMDTLHAIGDAARLVGDQARMQVAPTVPLPPLFLAATTATWAAVFSAHALAFRAGSPLLALIPPVALVAFPDTAMNGGVSLVYGLAFLLAALVLVHADGLRRVRGWGPVWSGKRGSHAAGIAGSGATKVAATTLVLALIAPLWLPGFGSKALLDLSHTSGGLIEIDPLVKVGAWLSQDAGTEAFQVVTSNPSYWRLLALSDFSDGKAWRPDPNPSTVPMVDGVVPLPTPVPAGSIAVQTDFHVSNALAIPWLPTPYPVTSVDLSDDPLSYDRDSGALIVGHQLGTGTEYRTSSVLVQPTPDELRAVQLPTAAQDPVDTELPVDDSIEAIGALATSWVQGASTDYDKVIAIQDHLNSSEFQYDVNVNQRNDTLTLLDFLTKTKKGFCQQFSAAMAVMLRSIGIPARVAIGFTPGTEDPATDTWTVTTKDAHSWVEVFFPGYGWLSFEPTPGKGDPTTDSYTHPTSTVPCPAEGQQHGGCRNIDGGSSDQTGAGSRKANPTPDQLRHRGELGNGSLTLTRTPPGRRWPDPRKLVLAALLAVLLVLALMPPARALRRRVRLRLTAHDPRRLILATYDVFTERLGELGFPRAPGETLEEYRSRLTSAELPVDGHLDRLTAIAVGAAYAPGDPTMDEARAATDAASAAWHDMKGGTSIVRRLIGAYRPS